ncbi:DUF1559 domain-containing protein [Anatilimnocola sp. NA78]|uniref:DUF1559 family PulG-like putative transporter n=1 Tax=Anatilimnocola sp. NA78 TaxID=3415683 RepID=UPI003CE4BF7F
MFRFCCILSSALVMFSFAGCGESKLDKMKRLASVGNADDPQPTNPAPAPPVVQQQQAQQPKQPVAAAISPPVTPTAVQPMQPVAPAAAQLPGPPVVVHVPPPVSTLSPSERRERTIRNLQAIATALESYMQNSNSVPAPAFVDDGTQSPLLSWRVAILPLLGHSQLYSKFRLSERWDSTNNFALLKQIPPEFQSPDRPDEKTNYLCPIGQAVAMAPTNNRSFQQFKDGLANTLLVVEADDSQAVPWTKPADLPIKLEAPHTGLGSLREDGFFAILVNATVCRVPKETTPDQLRALLTFAGGENFKAKDLVKEPSVYVESPVVASTATEAPAAGDTGTTPAIIPAASAVIASPTPAEKPQERSLASINLPAIVELLAQKGQPRVGVIPVPAEAELITARTQLRDVYARDYASAKRPEEKQRLAQQMIADAAAPKIGPAEQHEMLRIARDLSVQAGDYATAKQALANLEKLFDADLLSLRAKTLSDFQQAAARSGQLESLAADAQSVVSQSLQQSQFESALTALDLLVAIYRTRQNKQGLAAVDQLRQQIDTAKAAYKEVPAALDVLSQNPADPQACEVVGKYICLVRNRWDLGLPLLVRSEDIRLKFVATIDLEENKTPKTLLQLGDSYWQLADEFKGSQRVALQVRAYSCYEQALPQVDGGLEQIKIQKRMNELVNGLGKQTIEQILAADPSAIKPANLQTSVSD